MKYLTLEKNRTLTLFQCFSAGFALLGAFLALLAGPLPNASAAEGTGIIIRCGDADWYVDEFWCDAVILPETLFNATTVDFTLDTDEPVTFTGVRTNGRPLNAPYPLGYTSVNWTATDALGKPGTCTQLILVYTDYAWGCPAPRFATTHLRDTVGEVRDFYKTDLSKFNSAINYLNKALDPSRWIGEMPKEGAAGEGVFSNGKSAAGQLVPLKGKYNEVVAILYRLVDVDRNIAQTAIDGAPPTANASKIKTANNYLAKADAHVALGQLTDAIDDYKNAWKNAAAAY